MPPRSGLKMSDDEIRESLEQNQLKLQRERGTDLTIFSPRASGMGHHIGDESVSHGMDADLQRPDPPRASRCSRRTSSASASCRSRPACRPTNPSRSWSAASTSSASSAATSIPDPSGGYFNAPPLTDRSWYPFYEKMVELDVPAMIHVSGCCNPAMHTTGSHYLNADTMAFMQLILSDLFKDFPTLKLIIPHGGGAVPFHWGRFRGIALNNGKPELDEIMATTSSSTPACITSRASTC